MREIVLSKQIKKKNKNPLSDALNFVTGLDLNKLKLTPKDKGFKNAISYVLDLLCYAYYVKNDSLVSDKAFDELELIYRKLTLEKICPLRGIEFDGSYSYGVKFIYSFIRESKDERRRIINDFKK